MQITNFKFHQPLKHLENRHHPLFMSGRSDESEQLTAHLLVHLLSYTISMVLILWFLEIVTCILFLKMVPQASHWCFTAESKRIFTMWTSWNASLWLYKWPEMWWCHWIVLIFSYPWQSRECEPNVTTQWEPLQELQSSIRRSDRDFLNKQATMQANCAWLIVNIHSLVRLDDCVVPY